MQNEECRMGVLLRGIRTSAFQTLNSVLRSAFPSGAPMTRETKIGLLVGLAFIIVIGILLSDHMSSTNEPTSAPLANAGNNVRDGVTSPAGENQPAVVASVSPSADAPRSPVPTQADLNPPAPPTGHVEVGPGSG